MDSDLCAEPVGACHLLNCRRPWLQSTYSLCNQPSALLCLPGLPCLPCLPLPFCTCCHLRAQVFQPVCCPQSCITFSYALALAHLLICAPAEPSKSSTNPLWFRKARHPVLFSSIHAVGRSSAFTTAVLDKLQKRARFNIRCL